MSGLSAIDNDSQTTTSSYITFTVEPPYVDIYPRSVFGGDYITNSNKCTWLLCGGDALYETSRVDEVTAENYNFAGWGGDGALFGYGSSPWFTRGGSYSIGYMAGLFYYGWGSSDAGENNSFRVALLTI